jgi:hypothetical protein
VDLGAPLAMWVPERASILEFRAKGRAHVVLISHQNSEFERRISKLQAEETRILAGVTELASLASACLLRHNFNLGKYLGKVFYASLAGKTLRLQYLETSV